MQYYPFDSRNPLYRSVQTALAAGSPLRLRLLLHRNAACTAAFLRLRRDEQSEITEIPLSPGEWLEDYQIWDTTLSCEEGLYWYAFRYESANGNFFVIQAEHSLGIVSQTDGVWWQLTVYEGDYQGPDWLAGGIIYQIFPDRYCNSGIKKANLPSDRFCQPDWYAQPAFLQNGQADNLGNDYFGGDLAGITAHLDDLKALGVSCLYLNPIFEAHSNHRYNTADYFKIDPHLGTEADFVALCRAAKAQGIAVILDGVFSHTGDDSRYFNKYGRYETLGAYQSPASPYASWYQFTHWPEQYHSWWGVPSLPEVNELGPDFLEFITGENGVIRHWMRLGASGWRLDVADELPDAFLDAVRRAVKAEKPDGYLLGEVWEDATNKISYGVRRRFLRGRQLDAVMNYPLATALIEFLRGGNGRDLLDCILTLREHYPPEAFHLSMNHIGTHDTARILTQLGRPAGAEGDRAWQSRFLLNAEEKARGKRLLKLASVLQYTLPGVPSLYYGDEAGMEGFGDPFCRAGYPWGREDKDLLAHYRTLGSFRRTHPAFQKGEFIPLHGELGHIAYLRESHEEVILVAVNRWCDPVTLSTPDRFEKAQCIYGQRVVGGKLTVGAEDYALLVLPKQ